MRTLKPIYDHDSYSLPIAKQIDSYLFHLIFAPLFAILRIEKENRTNSKASGGALLLAIQQGRLQYTDGYFIGPLTAAISKELRGIGARYNKTKKAYNVERSTLPQDIKVAISEANRKAKEKLKEVEDYLYAIQNRELRPLMLKPILDNTIEKLEQQFKVTTKQLTGTNIEVPISEALKDKVAEAYTENLQPYIRDWYDEQILRLRAKVQKNVSAGFRADQLIDTIQAERNVSFNKANFLAKQETSLMVSKYRQIRYEDVGIRRYMWSTSHDSRVRHSHKELDKKIFSFDSPPVVDPATGKRANPGEDFGCRCVAIPVLTDKESLTKGYMYAGA